MMTLGASLPYAPPIPTPTTTVNFENDTPSYAASPERCAGVSRPYRRRHTHGQRFGFAAVNGATRFRQKTAGATENLYAWWRTIGHTMSSSSGIEAELRTRVRQQEFVADLCRRALAAGDAEQLVRDASVAVAETLDSDSCAVFELLLGGDDIPLGRGIGWRDDLVENATVPADTDSHAGCTLFSGGRSSA